MPTYQYRCTECGRDLEVVQKFSDASLTECPTCAGQLRKVFNAVGVVFKGSGFYRTDSRAANGSSDGGEKKSDKATEKSGESSDSKPAKVDAAKSDSGSNGSAGSGSGKSDGGKSDTGKSDGSRGKVTAGTSSTGSKAAAS